MTPENTSWTAHYAPETVTTATVAAAIEWVK